MSISLAPIKSVALELVTIDNCVIIVIIDQ